MYNWEDDRGLSSTCCLLSSVLFVFVLFHPPSPLPSPSPAMAEDETVAHPISPWAPENTSTCICQACFAHKQHKEGGRELTDI